MTISRAIIDDLYPLYAAGEASADSRALIEEYLTEHPDAAASLRIPLKLPPVEPPMDLEGRALRRTARLLEQRSMLGTVALSLSYAPTAVGFLEQGKLHLLYLDLPWLAAALYAAAVGLWVGFFQVCRLVQATGLRPRRTWTARFVWLLTGTMIGFAIVLPVQHWTGWQRAYADLPWVVGTLAWALGERLGQVAKVEEITRPTTIFGPHDDDGSA